jgi:hypothetical protein
VWHAINGFADTWKDQRHFAQHTQGQAQRSAEVRMVVTGTRTRHATIAVTITTVTIVAVITRIKQVATIRPCICMVMGRMLMRRLNIRTPAGHTNPSPHQSKHQKRRARPAGNPPTPKNNRAKHQAHYATHRPHSTQTQPTLSNIHRALAHPSTASPSRRAATEAPERAKGVAAQGRQDAPRPAPAARHGQPWRKSN